MAKRKTGPEYRQKIIDLYTDGSTVRAAAAEVGVHEATASKWLKQAGIEIGDYRNRVSESWQSDVGAKISEAKTGKQWTPKQHASRAKQVAEDRSKFYEGRSCQFCGKAFEARTRVKQEFCSLSCSQRHTREKFKIENGHDRNQGHLSPEAISVFKTKESLTGYIGDRKITTTQLADELSCSPYLPYSRLKEFDLWHLVDERSSTGEKEVSDLLDAWGIFWEKTRSILPGRQEIDIYIPALRLGIEFNGDYWHSDDVRPPGYHQAKTDEAAKLGVRLYHIWEHEWQDVRIKPIIISQLLNMVGLSPQKIFARKCKIVEVPLPQRRSFLDVNHIQGDCPATIAYGLEHKGRLVLVMSFGQPRHPAHRGVYEWELLRLCSAMDTSVVGGASKLFSHFIKQHDPASVVSFSANDKTVGKVYPVLGFDLESEGKGSPSYVWADLRGNTLTRGQVQGPNERERMTSQGWVRITKCGNRRWVWKRFAETPPSAQP